MSSRLQTPNALWGLLTLVTVTTACGGSAPSKVDAAGSAGATMDASATGGATGTIDTAVDSSNGADAIDGSDATFDVLADGSAPSGGQEVALFEAGMEGASPDATDENASCAVVPTGLVAWWPANNSASDVVGNNNGMFDGGYVGGEAGAAFSVTSSAYVVVPSTPTLSPPMISVVPHPRGGAADPV